MSSQPGYDAIVIGSGMGGLAFAKLNRVVATILLENTAMRELVSRCGFHIQGNADMGVVQAILAL